MKDARISNYQLLTVIVGRGKAKKVVSLAKSVGVPGATISLGGGSNHNSFFNFLGIANEDKDIIFMVSDPETIDHAVEILDKELALHKPNHGIAFVEELAECSGVHRLNKNKPPRMEGDRTVYQLITVIVDRGKAEEVIESSRKAGSRGGTILNARGSGAHEHGKIFNIEIVPEKEVVLILCKSEQADAIMSQIEEDFKIHDPGKGIMYSKPVLKAVGIME